MKELLEKLEAIRTSLGEDRDKLRDLIEDSQSLLEPIEQACESIDQAIEFISQQA